MATGVFPPHPAGTCLNFIAHRVQHVHFYAFYFRRFASNFASSRSRAFGLSTCKQKKYLKGFKLTTSTSIVTRLTIEPPVAPAFNLIAAKNGPMLISSSCFFRDEPIHLGPYLPNSVPHRMVLIK